MTRLIDFASSVLAAAFVVLLLLAAGVCYETVALADETLSAEDCNDTCQCKAEVGGELCHYLGNAEPPECDWGTAWCFCVSNASGGWDCVFVD